MSGYQAGNVVVSSRRHKSGLPQAFLHGHSTVPVFPEHASTRRKEHPDIVVGHSFWSAKDDRRPGREIDLPGSSTGTGIMKGCRAHLFQNRTGGGS
jgi:hypothetical protein